MIKGVIYLYLSPSQKCYVGQTIDEIRRRKRWFGTDYKYAGDKINRARAKYGAENFIYKTLFTKEFENIDTCKEALDNLEVQFIKEYNSYENGYNLTIGGNGSKGYVPSLETRQLISKINTGRIRTEETKEKISNTLKGVKHSEERKIKAGVAHNKKVLQLSLEGLFIKEFASIKDAALEVGCDRTTISKVLKGVYKTAGGYIWKYVQ